MIPEVYREVFDRLAKKTFQNEVNWSRSPQQGSYVVSSEDFSLSISCDFDDVDNEQFVSIRLINDLGRDADRIWVSESEPEWGEAIALYEGAKRKAHRIDVTLQKVLEELRKPGSIGEPLEDPEDPEGFPF